MHVFGILVVAILSIHKKK
ncbi:hypothetical protein [Brevibacillus humidisoli]